jgi:multicomponent Na+:H+ antiporter subunit E
MGTPALKVWIDFAVRLLIFALLWQIVNPGDPQSWILGAPFVLAAALLSRQLQGKRIKGIRWLALVFFAVYFVRKSFAGGFDVACRVLHPRLNVAPGLVHFDTSLPEGLSRTLFIDVISLLPGTVSAGMEEDRIVVHAIDVNAGLESSLRDLERRVGNLFIEMEKAKE